MLALFVRRSTGLNVTLLRATSASSHNTLYQPSTFSFSTAGFKPSATQVKQLRDMTGSPLKDCLKVLTETAGDIPKSKDLLRKRGLADAEKRSDRLATEGLIGLTVEDEKITMVQFSCETDFVAKTDRFRDGLDAILNTIHSDDNTSAGTTQTSDEALLSHISQNLKLAESLDSDVASQTIEDAIKFTISKTQENCQLQRVLKIGWNPSDGQVAQTYLHNKVKPGVGKIGSVFLLDSGDASLNGSVEEIAKTLAMHAAAMKPSYLTKDEIKQEVIDQVVEEAKEQAEQKLSPDMPEKARERAMAGVAAKAVKKLEKRDVLFEQDLATSDDSVSVQKFLQQESERLGKTISIKQWALFMIK